MKAVSEPASDTPLWGSAQLKRFLMALAALVLAFAKPLYSLIQFAQKSDTFSYIILVPFISGYLAYIRRNEFARPGSDTSLRAFITAGEGVLLLTASWLSTAPETRLCFMALAFASFVLAAGFQWLGASSVRALAFPFALLFFMAPFPPAVLHALEGFFQHASALAAAVMISISGLPAMRDGLHFYLPGLTIEVAQECSGIRSTLVLFLTSLIAGHLLLRSAWKRTLLACCVIPLAIARNGFRIFSLAWLSVEVNPDIIHSPLHHRGGPIFFALSLIPFCLLLVILRKIEARRMQHAA